ncbi:redoxin domain-containing protein [Methylocapsa sp. D3K7]|uniref:redoxin domain-containing protein n=1 Tax=Methylocapsa sp. D3K7 TaxID=3041435 RepID=UPI00244E8E2F|nr:redoxin domain-containing protein [Methylocapsa sp. D3K7]WGJ13228.1 redoxin domain-containing protein [Methylocapsa sp. D3K7]
MPRLLPPFISLALALAALSLAVMPSLAEALHIGQPAPDFTGTDSNGETLHLSDLNGKPVVLEWTNNGCPYVKKWYSSGAMQKLQREAATLGVVWLTIASSAPGEQGFVDAAQANEDTATRDAARARVLLDPLGKIGHLYGAETTPHIFVIKQDGKLAYMGGADSIASTRIEDIAKAEPYAHEAIEAVATGKPVPHPVTRPYGCSVKYSS